MTADCSPMLALRGLAAAPGLAPAAITGPAHPSRAPEAPHPRGGPMTAGEKAFMPASPPVVLAANTGLAQPNCAHKAPHPRQDPMTAGGKASTLVFPPADLSHPSSIPGVVR